MRTSTSAVLASSVLAISPLIASSAIAQEATQPNWMKIYIGGHIGYDWSSIDNFPVNFSEFDGTDFITLPGGGPPPGTPSFSGSEDDSIIGGILGGWNFFQGGSIIIGIEGDVSWTGAEAEAAGIRETFLTNGSDATNITETINLSADVDWKASLRARAGILATNNILIFVSGGIAWAEVDVKQISTVIDAGAFTTVTTTSSSDDNTHVGWVVSAGGDWRFAEGLTARIEALYFDFGSETYNFDDGTSTKVEMEEVVARVALTIDLN